MGARWGLEGLGRTACGAVGKESPAMCWVLGDHGGTSPAPPLWSHHLAGETDLQTRERTVHSGHAGGAGAGGAEGT